MAYRKSNGIAILKEKKRLVLQFSVAFVVLDPRQEKDYDKGICYFLEHIPVKVVYPMHYWEKSHIIEKFSNEHPEYQFQIKKTE